MLSKTEPFRIVVIGGGIAGLTAAYRLQQNAALAGRPVHITLLEASSRVGGALHTLQRDRFLIETGPDCFGTNKPEALRLCRDLDLGGQLIETLAENRVISIVHDGRFLPVPDGLSLMAPTRLSAFLSSRILNWHGKFRAMAEFLIPARPQEDESVASFVRRRFGREAFERLVRPFVEGFFSADPEVLSIRAAFPQFVDMERKRGGVLRGLCQRIAVAEQARGVRCDLIMSLRGGLGALVDALERALGNVVQLRSPVAELRRVPHAGRWEVVLQGGAVLEAEALCLALPAIACADLLRSWIPFAAQEMRGIHCFDSATLTLAFRESELNHLVDGFGFVSSSGEGRDVLSCTFSHRKFEGRAPDGHALLRVFVGGALQPELLDMDDTELGKVVYRDLGSLLGIKAKPLFSVLRRHHGTLPICAVGHAARIERIRKAITGLPSVALAGNWLQGIGIPDTIASAEQAAGQLQQFFMSDVREALHV